MIKREVEVFVSLPVKARRKFISPEAQAKLSSFARVIWNEENRPLTEREKPRKIESCDGIITGWGDTGLTENNLKLAKNLKIIGVVGGDVKKVSPNAALNRGVTIVNASRAMGNAVAEYTLCLILCSLRDVITFNDSLRVRNGNITWGVIASLYEDRIGTELTGKKIGLIGIGVVARRLIELLKPFHVEIIAYDPYVSSKTAAKLGIKLGSLKEVLSGARIISLHAGLTKETYHMIGKDELDLIQDDTVLVNTARGSLIDEKTLIEHLKKGNIKAALDVFSEEPLPEGSKLRTLNNVILSPHQGANTKEVCKKIGMSVVEDFELFFSGKRPRNVVTKRMLDIMT